ncbi:hypothetical protein BH23PLA1_BH23PLA1_05570 [soil metagenome]
MSAEAQQIPELALALPREKYAAIADKLLASLVPSDPEVDRKWIEEAKSRLAAYDAGLVQAIDTEQFFAKTDEP